MTVKAKLLDCLEHSEGALLSGEQLAQKLGCTRSAIWKSITSLREEGYVIEAAQNRGYRLIESNRKLSEDRISSWLENPGVTVKVCETIDSTNQAAKKAALAGEAGHGSFVVAAEQTAGRGRRGRSFFSPKGSGLYLSIVLRPEGTLQENLMITAAAATAVHRAARQVLGISTDIKWVNDLYYHGKKVCGILTEAATDFETGMIDFLIVGIGINLYRPASGIPKELEEIMGFLYESAEEARAADKSRFIAVIVNELIHLARDRRIDPEYVRFNMIPGKDIRIINGDSVRLAHAEKILPDGRLLVLEADGSESALSFGEVSVREAPGGQSQTQR